MRQNGTEASSCAVDVVRDDCEREQGAFTWEAEGGVEYLSVCYGMRARAVREHAGRAGWRALLWLWGVLVEAVVAVDAEALDRGVGLQVALDEAHRLVVAVGAPGAFKVVGGGALLAPFVHQADALGEARALDDRGGAEGGPNSYSS